MRVLIIGLGIGQVYVEQCRLRNFDTYTLDLDASKHPVFTSVEEAKKLTYDMVIICVPNFLHEFYILEFKGRTPLILVEKPGLKTAEGWIELYNRILPTKMVMVKNSMFRDFSSLVPFFPAKRIDITWATKNRVPNPGGWFTNSQKSWGGVSYDIMPHLLHMMLAMERKFTLKTRIKAKKFQKYKLKDIESTEYGAITQAGVYDVDDHCYLQYFSAACTKVNLLAVWKTDELTEDKQELLVTTVDGTKARFKFGLCPNEVYGRMLDSILYNSRVSSDFFNQQLSIDSWVIRQIEQVNIERFSVGETLK